MRPTVTDLGPFLDHDEKVRWSGQPPDGVIFRGYDFFVIPFSVLWGGFALFWNIAVWLVVLAAALQSGWRGVPATVWVFPIFGVPFLVAGYYFAIGRFQSDALDRKKTLYALTNRRAIIAKGPTVREVRGYEFTRGALISISERGDGSGSITFGQRDRWFAPAGTTWHHIPEFKFERIAQVREVVRLIDEIQRDASP